MVTVTLPAPESSPELYEASQMLARAGERPFDVVKVFSAGDAGAEYSEHMECMCETMLYLTRGCACPIGSAHTDECGPGEARTALWAPNAKKPEVRPGWGLPPSAAGSAG